MPLYNHKIQYSVQSLSCVQLFVTPWIAACQASLSITNSQSLLKLMSIKLVMPSNHLVLCHHPFLLLPSIFPSIRIFSNKSVLYIRWPKYWSFSISPSNEHSGLISFRMVLVTASCTMSRTSVHSSSGSLPTRSNPLNLFDTSLYNHKGFDLGHTWMT